MNAEQATMFANYFVPATEQEVATTKKVIQAVPDDRKDYKPDPRSMSAHELAWHIATTDAWIISGVVKGKFEMEGPPPPAPATIREILDWYDTNMAKSIADVKIMSGEDLARVVPFFGMEMPNVTYLSMMNSHSIHHRGQLSAYLRPMGAKVPSIYGGSADEPFQMESGAGA